MEKKKNKKKIIILVLFLICVFGIVGYGVYSYYFVTGTFSNDTSVNLGIFDPQNIIDEDVYDFLGQGGTININCPTLQTGNEDIVCSGSLTLKNNGSGPITIEVLDVSSGESESYTSGDSGSGDDSGDESDSNSPITPSDPVFNWTTRTFAAGETAALSVSIPVSVVTDYGSSEPVEYNGEFDPFCDYETGICETSPVTVGQVAIRFKLKATQIINNN